MLDGMVVPLDSSLAGPESDASTKLLRWLQEALLEGEAILKDDPAYHQIDRSIAFLMGNQVSPRRHDALSNVTDNKLKDITLKTVAGLTDIHPLFGFKTFNPQFEAQSEILDKLTRSWWQTSFADLKIADVVKFSMAGSTGYCEVVWDQSIGGGMGDIRLIPRDPRDVIPIRPIMGGSIQDWAGVVIRSSKSINEVRQRFKNAEDIRPSRGGTSIMSRTWSRAKAMTWNVLGPAVTDIRKAPQDNIGRIPTVDVCTYYLHDYSVLEGSQPKLMGDEGTSWSYWVYPEGTLMPNGKKATEQDARLYPRGRMIIAVVDQKVLWDGPNPYWHGMFPVCRLQLDPWPWSFLGGNAIADLIPLQEAINDMTNGILDAVKKALKPGIIADKRSVPESLWQKIDTRLPGLRVKQNTMAGKGIEFTDPPNLPSWVFEFLMHGHEEIEKLSGVANLEALTQLNQAPAADSVEKMMEALSPVLRLKGRLLEGFLREMGEMVKGNFFQFYNMPRRMSILGEEGIDFTDFDFDPGTMVPSMAVDDPGYQDAYDASLSRADRAKVHHKNFTFQIAPNSLLAISQLSRKLTYLQLARMGAMDIWSLWDVLEIPNGGEPPNGATTISERLAAQNMMGLGQTVSPAGRKATGQAPPQIQVKPDQDGAPRVAISESGG